MLSFVSLLSESSCHCSNQRNNSGTYKVSLIMTEAAHDYVSPNSYDNHITPLQVKSHSDDPKEIAVVCMLTWTRTVMFTLWLRAEVKVDMVMTL